MEDRDARSVEITLALLLGVAVAVLPLVALWVAGRVWGLDGPGWGRPRRRCGSSRCSPGPP